MSIRAADIGGYEPFVSRRYAEFVAFTQDEIRIRRMRTYPSAGYHPLYGMLRCRYAFLLDNNEWQIAEFKDVLPRLLLVQEYAVVPRPRQIFGSHGDRTGLIRGEQVILGARARSADRDQSEARGTVRLVDSSTDHLTIEADLPAPRSC